MNSKRERWERIKTEWPQLAGLLLELKKEGMDVADVDVEVWPEGEHEI